MSCAAEEVAAGAVAAETVTGRTVAGGTVTGRTALGGKRYTLLDVHGQPYRSAMPGTFGGHRGAKLYGRLDCASARRAIEAGGYVTSRIFFADEQTAVAAGYRPCAVCLPEAYRIWKAQQ
jgi:metal binding Ada-like protein